MPGDEGNTTAGGGVDLVTAFCFPFFLDLCVCGSKAAGASFANSSFPWLVLSVVPFF